VLGRHCFADVSLVEAINAPRLHVSFTEDGVAEVQFEDDPALAGAVARSGLRGVVHSPHSMFFGGVGAAHRRADGSLAAAADIRRQAATGVG